MTDSQAVQKDSRRTSPGAPVGIGGVFSQLIPAGPGSRRLIGQIALCQGIAYLLIVILERPLTASYQRQLSFAPLWVWGLMLIGLGGLFWWTATRYRYHLFGRITAVAMLGLQVWFAATFAQAGALTALGQYIPIVLVILAEAVFIGEETIYVHLDSRS